MIYNGILMETIGISVMVSIWASIGNCNFDLQSFGVH